MDPNLKTEIKPSRDLHLYVVILSLNCEGEGSIPQPRRKRDREPTVCPRWSVRSSCRSLPPSLPPPPSHCRGSVYLWLDRAELCRAGRNGGSWQKAAAQVVSSPPVTPLLRPQVKKSARGHIPGVALRKRLCTNSQGCSCARTHAHTNAHATWSSKEQPRGDSAENRK